MIKQKRVRNEDITGNIYGLLTAVRFSHKNKHGDHCWFFLCECGKEKFMIKYDVKNGKCKSCGCRVGFRVKHKLSRSKIYITWQHIKQRCLNKNDASYKNYGGRGIKVCDRWIKFDNFLEDMGHPPTNKSLDRIDNNGNYEPNNCRWATNIEQLNNTRRNININHNGKILSLAGWCRSMKIDYKKAYYHKCKGLSLEGILLKLNN